MTIEKLYKAIGGDYEKAFKMGLCTGSASAFNEGFAHGDEIMQLYRLVR